MSYPKNRWENFANKNAEYYILTVEGIDYSTEEGKKFFFDSGEEFVRQCMQNVNPFLKQREHALEIGCGIGRLTLPHAKLFNSVSAVDISPTMLQRLQDIAKHKLIQNISVFLPEQKWDDIRYDYAYSFIVFQHILDPAIIENYIARIARSLKTGGVAQLHFDTRPRNLLYKLRNNIPDALLPKSQRKGIRRIRRDAASIRALFTRNHLTILNEIQANTENHTFILQR